MTINPLPDEPLLTAIVPISLMAGRLERLDRWLSNVGSQPINIVLIHDVRDEQTQHELMSLLNRHKNLDINFISGEYGSPGSARNAGLRTELAKWVTFWDSDDIPNIQTFINAIADAGPSAEIIIGNFAVNTPTGIELNQHHGDLNKVAISPGIWRFIFKSAVIQNTFFTDARMGEDQVFLLETNFAKRNIMFVDSILYNYFKDSNLQLTSNQKAINEIIFSFNYAKKLLKMNPKLRNSSSQIIMTRLYLTTLMKCKPENKLNFLLRNSSQLILLHPKSFLKVLFMLGNLSRRKEN